MQTIDQVIRYYTESVCEVLDGSSAGAIRSTKGRVVEDIAEAVVRIAWHSIGGQSERIRFVRGRFPIPIRKEELRIFPEPIQAKILNSLDSYVYRVGVDKHVHIDGAFVLGIECKAYTENAMLKRILCDFYLLKKHKTSYIDLSGLQCCLLQLETFLGGTNSSPRPKVSWQTNRLTPSCHIFQL